MVVSRASGTPIASSLKQNTFLALELHPAEGSRPPLHSVTQVPPADVGGNPPDERRWVTVLKGTPYVFCPRAAVIMLQRIMRRAGDVLRRTVLITPVLGALREYPP